MGRFLLVWRLAWKDLRHRSLEAALLLLAVGGAATTLTLGLALHGVTNAPYARTRAATHGPDVVANIYPDKGPTTPGPPEVAELQPLEHAQGVVAHSGPFPVSWAVLRVGRTTAVAEIEGRDRAPAGVDQPKLTDGSWIRPGGVVVEGGFASALGVRVGDQLRLAGIPFHVIGTAMTAAMPSYGQLCEFGCDELNVPSGEAGLVWLTRADTTRVARAAHEPAAYFLNLKLSDPANATSFANTFDASTLSKTAPYLVSWQDVEHADASAVRNMRLVLLTGSWLLVLLALASVAVLVGGRMAEQSRRVGLLKAVGGTPGLVAVVLVVEHVLVGIGAAAIGLLAGRLTAPLLDRPGAGLIGAAGAPALDPANVGLVLALASGVAVAATSVPAWRAARTSTVSLLDDAVRLPRRATWVIKLSAHLPAPLLVGVRLAVRRPRRLVLGVFSVAITASGIMAALIVHASEASGLTPNNPQNLRLNQVTTVLSVMLVLLAAVNAILIAWAIILDTRHAGALARALGATPEQVTVGITVAQLLPALFGALVGIPGGIAIYDAAKNGGTTTTPAAGWIVVMVVGTVVAVALLTAIPARVGAHRPAAEVLQAEAA